METKTKIGNYFICLISSSQVQDDGMMKKVKEQYVVDAESFTDAEKKITDECGTADDFTVEDISRAPFKEVAYINEQQEGWFKVKLKFITIDEKSEKEKATKVCYLVESSSTAQAQQATEAMMQGSMLDYSITSIVETKIIEVFN